jgi:hypothetical protein
VSGERVSLRDLLRGLAWAALRRAWVADEGHDRTQAIRDWFTWQILAWRTPPDVMVPADSQRTTWSEDEVRA